MNQRHEEKNLPPSRIAARRRLIPETILTPEAISAAPAKYVQKSRRGIQDGTSRMLSWEEEKCSKPKMTSGTANTTGASA